MINFNFEQCELEYTLLFFDSCAKRFVDRSSMFLLCQHDEMVAIRSFAQARSAPRFLFAQNPSQNCRGTALANKRGMKRYESSGARKSRRLPIVTKPSAEMITRSILSMAWPIRKN